MLHFGQSNSNGAEDADDDNNNSLKQDKAKNTRITFVDDDGIIIEEKVLKSVRDDTKHGEPKMSITL